MGCRRNHLAVLSVLCALALSAMVFAPPAGADSKSKAAPEPLKLKVGDTAPDFTLLSFDGKGLNKVSLHDYRGKKNVALAFYVFAFTGG